MCMYMYAWLMVRSGCGTEVRQRYGGPFVCGTANIELVDGRPSDNGRLGVVERPAAIDDSDTFG